MTLEVLSSLTGIPASTISRLECGETKKLDIAKAVLIAKALDVRVDELIDLAEKCDNDESRKLMQSIQGSRRATTALRRSFFEKIERMRHGGI